MKTIAKVSLCVVALLALLAAWTPAQVPDDSNPAAVFGGVTYDRPSGHAAFTVGAAVPVVGKVWYFPRLVASAPENGSQSMFTEVEPLTFGFGWAVLPKLWLAALGGGVGQWQQGENVPVHRVLAGSTGLLGVWMPGKVYVWAGGQYIFGPEDETVTGYRFGVGLAFPL